MTKILLTRFGICVNFFCKFFHKMPMTLNGHPPLHHKSFQLLLNIYLFSNSLDTNLNKTGLQPVSRPVERVHYLGGGVGVQSTVDAIAVHTVTLYVSMI